MDSPGGLLSYARRGSGRPLLFIHGFMLTHAMFEPIATGLVAYDFEALLPDLRGHGRSATLGGPYGTSQMAADVVAVLDDAGIGSADVFGYSQGGAVAFQLARAYPDRVRRLVVGGTWARNNDPLLTRAGVAILPRMLRLFGSERLARSLYLMPALGGGEGVSREQVGWVRAMMAANDPAAVGEAIRASAFDCTSWLHEIRAPVLVLAGEKDTAAPLDQARALAEGIPRSELLVLPRAGHAMIWTHASTIIRATREWLLEGAVRRADGPPPGYAGVVRSALEGGD